MNDLDDSVAHYVAWLGTPRSEDAFFGLLHLCPRAVPHLASAFFRETRSEARAVLVEVIWQSRNPDAIPFLAQVLEDPDPEVGKQALDGLVTIGGPRSIAEIQRVRARVIGGAARTPSLEWLDEALDQLGVPPSS